MHYGSKLALFFRDTINIPRIFSHFDDIRLNPRIPLRNILLSVFLMPFWGLTALLHLDTRLRTPQMLKLFRCPKNKKVVVSDTTIERVLTWIRPTDSRAALLAPCSVLEDKGLLERQLAPHTPLRRLAVFDGSQMGDHYLVAALLCGQVNYPLMVEPCKGRGHELKTSQSLMPVVHQLLGPAAPQLWLLDPLYFNNSTFKIVRDLQSHLLIKYTPKEDQEGSKLFRDVLEDAAALFAAHTKAIDEIPHAHGFDTERWCDWSMKKVTLEFGGYPVNVFLLIEDYPKRKRNSHVETWIITTDLTLSFEEAREAAHLRWQIENNEFKRISHLSGTKKFYFKDPRPFFTMLRVFCLALVVFDTFFSMLRQKRAAHNALMQGCKFTWKTAFSQMWWQYPDAFEYLVTAER